MKSDDRVERLERLPGSEPLISVVADEPWYDKDHDGPEYFEVTHDKIKEHLSSSDVQPGGSLTIYVQPPGKEVGGRECAPIEARYELVEKPETAGETSGRVDLMKVRNYMVTSRKYKAEVLSGDTVELWATSKPDHFVLGLIKEVCWVCSKETGDAAYGLAYICEDCNKSVHARCAGLKKNLREDEDFFCRRCRPTVAEDVIGEEVVGEEAEEEEPDEEEADGEENPEQLGDDKPNGEEKQKDKKGKAKEQAKEKKGKAKDSGAPTKRKKEKDVKGEAAEPKSKKRGKAAAQGK